MKYSFSVVPSLLAVVLAASIPDHQNNMESREVSWTASFFTEPGCERRHLIVADIGEEPKICQDLAKPAFASKFSGHHKYQITYYHERECRSGLGTEGNIINISPHGTCRPHSDDRPIWSYEVEELAVASPIKA